MGNEHHISRRSLIALMGAVTANSGFSLSALAQESALAEEVALTPEPALDLTPVQQVSDYLNGLKSLKGRFRQIAPSGQLDTGTFYLRRPGRMRFEYDDPNPLVIISDGTWIMLNDRALETVDRYPLRSTPLKFLLKKDVDLGSDTEILDISPVEPDGVVITAQEDKKADEETAQGQISLYFGQEPMELRQWQIIDAQGYRTTVAFEGLERDLKLDASLFVIKEENNRFQRRKGR